jgi:hypothetical protein
MHAGEALSFSTLKETHPMKLHKMFAIAAMVLTGLSLAHASPLVGKWTAEFDTQIGVQKYVYEFKVEGDKITGKATYERSNGSGEAELKSIKLSGDDVSFVEPLNFDGNEIAITYTGKIAGDELKLTRQVGDFATEQIVAKRVKAPEVKPAPAK